MKKLINNFNPSSTVKILVKNWPVGLATIKKKHSPWAN